MNIELQPFAHRDFATMAKSVAGDEAGTKRMAFYTDAAEWAEATGMRRGALKAVNGNGKIVGFIDVELIGASDASFAYYIIPEARGKKLANEMLEMFKAWGVQHDVAMLTAYVEPDNTASRKVLDRANFLADGTLDGMLVYRTRIWA
jgi:RimJ/RimL family protein N-acetyltransferase